jgi:hypothetical protein
VVISCKHDRYSGGGGVVGDNIASPTRSNMSLFAAHTSCPLRGGPKLDTRTSTWRCHPACLLQHPHAFITNVFHLHFNVTSPARDDDAMREFMSVRASVIDEQKKMKKTSGGQAAGSTSCAASEACTAAITYTPIDRVDRDAAAAKFPQMILGHEYMNRLNYPSPAAPAPDGRVWIVTPTPVEPGSKYLQPVVAIDCEMVITSGGAQELARLTAVDVYGAVLLDMLVVPEAAVANYNTQFSGITKEMLKGALCGCLGLQSL